MDLETGLAHKRSSSNINNDDLDGEEIKQQNWVKHGLFLFFFCCVSAGVGVGTFFGTYNQQLTSFQTQFQSSATQLQVEILAGLVQKVAASRLIRKMIGHAAKLGCGTTSGEAPPFMTLPGFQEYAEEISFLAGSPRAIEWAPLVDTTNAATRLSWEVWSKKNIAVQTTGFDPSVFKTINTTAYTYGIYNKTSATTKARAGDVIPGADPRFDHWLFPIWQAAPLINNSGVMFLDVHQFVGTRMKTIEKVLAAGYGSDGGFTDLIQLVQDNYFRPSTILFAPVYSISPTPTLLGLTNIVFSWDELLLNALPTSLKRVDMVLTTKTTTFTLAVDQGKVTIVGQGDLHDPSMSLYGQAIVLDYSVYSLSSATDFRITVYPSSDFYNQYITKYPFNLSIGAAIICFAFVSILYFVIQATKTYQAAIRSEKENTLVALLDAKKSYVRYISHEMRTPLNAATLGLNMVVTQMKKKRRPTQAEQELVETLSDIRLACSTAVDILNDLLSFEKLESGILDLHRENISALKFMKEGIVMFSAQAKEKGVMLDLVSTVDEKTLEWYPNAIPLRSNDEFSCDRFKMDQVLRNIVSNAIKFSPQGGKVTIRAFFDKTPVVVPETKDIETGDLLPSKTNGKTRANIGRSFMGIGAHNSRSAMKVFASASSSELNSAVAGGGGGSGSGSNSETKSTTHLFSANSPNNSVSYRGSLQSGASKQLSRTELSAIASAVSDAGRGSISSGEEGSNVCDTLLNASNATVTSSELGNHGKLIIMVSDSGPGISEENQKKLFRSVIQFDPEKNQGGGGSGFGLFISKGIVDLHNGSISVRSEGEGHGSSFILAMPMVHTVLDPAAEVVQLLEAAAAAAAASDEDDDDNDDELVDNHIPSSQRLSQSHRRSSIGIKMLEWVEGVHRRISNGRGSFIMNSARGSGRGSFATSSRASIDFSPHETPRKRYRLLVVDDSGLSRKMMCKAMRAAGHECEEAGDGLVALNKVKEKLVGSGMYNAILMDRNMPVMDGPSAAKAMREIGVTVPIFGVTGDGEDNDIDYFKSHGATAVLVKPMDMNEFLRYMLQYGAKSQSAENSVRSIRHSQKSVRSIRQSQNSVRSVQG